MSLLNDASLVFIPSGYKEDKVYSVIPSNGAGDLDFVRGCDATRVNPQSLVENTPWNLLSYSEDFSAGWTLIGGGSFTSNAATAPNGTTTADKYNSGAYVRQILTMPINNVTFTLYVRAKTSSSSFRIGILGAGDSAIAQTIQTVSTSWTQMSVTYDNFGNSAIGVFFNILSGDTEVYLWGAQLNIGSTAKPYFPTTDRLNVPRLTYSPTLIERQSTNLFTYSQDFDNASWEKNNVSILANSISAPDGTSTADTITSTGTTSFAYKVTTSYTSGQYTLSFYAKKGTSDYIWVYLNGYNAIFDLNNGTYVTSITNAPDSYTIVALSNGWYRVSITKTNPSADTVSGIGVATASGFNGVVGTNVYIWGAQIETGSLTSYIPTTSTAVTRVASYNSGCPSLLLEKQSTNLLQRSEEFNNSYWEFGSAASVTANTTISPDGTQNADTLTANGYGSIFVRKNVFLGTGATCSVSVYAKKNNNPYVGLRNSGTTSQHDVFNFDTKTWTNNTGSVLSYEELSNGWFRLKSVNTDAVNLNYYWSVIPAVDTSGLETTSASNLSVYIWGGQAELSTYPTSYIPTTTATVTRLADSCSKTGISSLIGQTSGTVFWDINVETLSATGNENILNIDNGFFGNTIYFLKSSTGNLEAAIYNSGSGQCSFTYTIPAIGRYKMALAYATNDFTFYVNGILVGTDTSGSIPTTSRLQMGNGALGSSDGKINQALLFKRRLTNTELANLTTL